MMAVTGITSTATCPGRRWRVTGVREDNDQSGGRWNWRQQQSGSCLPNSQGNDVTRGR